MFKKRKAIFKKRKTRPPLVIILLAAGIAAIVVAEKLPDQTGQVASGTVAVDGLPHVIDADSLVIDDENIYLSGIDACERGQPAVVDGREIDCGAWATAQFQELLDGQAVRCVAAERDGLERLLAECFLPDGRSLNMLVLAAGIAFPYIGGAIEDRFTAAAQGAAAAGIGVWAFDAVENPHHYRRSQRQ